jgi:dihydroorotate dehydrogenase (NAD+) catalytic subunit
VRQSLPELPIVGVGGVASGWDAAELMIAGADAVQVGTASFADPRACVVVRDELLTWADEHEVGALADLRAVAWSHGNTSAVDS